jgi:predicted DNA-binding transcriptional regulator AlpA
MERILRKPEVRNRIPVGKTKFEHDIVPRLDKVHLGPRCVGFTESSVERVIGELIADSASAPDFVPAPNKKLVKRNEKVAAQLKTAKRKRRAVTAAAASEFTAT